MPAKRRQPKARRGYEPTSAEIAWLYARPAPEDANQFDVIELMDPEIDRPRYDRPTLRELWAEHSATVLDWWVRRHPGTRPPAWWLCDAPEPRLRLGGIGSPMLATLHNGIPGAWWPSLGGGGSRIVPVDPADPPRFESQAAYLRRLGLLRPGERRRIPASAFTTEVVSVPAPRRRAADAAAGQPEAGDEA